MSTTTSAPLLPLTSTSVKVSRNPPPSRIRLGRYSPGHLSLTRRYSSPPPFSPTDSQFGTPPTSLSGKLKLLIKTYGWYALGVYIAFGLVDFGIAFALINFLGAEQVSKWTAEIKAYVMDTVYGSRGESPEDVGMDKAVHAGGGHEGLYAMIILAYTVHKTLFLPFRVGMTAAFTPKIVKWLASRGWAGRAGTMRAANHMRDRVRQARGKDKIED